MRRMSKAAKFEFRNKQLTFERIHTNTDQILGIWIL